MSAPTSVRLSVAQVLPSTPEGAVAATSIAEQVGMPVRDVVRTLNALRELGYAERLVPGDGKRETPVARWIRSEDEHA